MNINQWLQASKLPRLEARMFLEHVLQWSRVQLITGADESIADQHLLALNNLARRRLLGEPMAYILGEREFYGRRFMVDEYVLIPRPETELLVEAVLAKTTQQSPAQVWDLGTGSGIVACTLALENPALTVYASDISEGALNMAQKNGLALGADVSFHIGSWYDVKAPIQDKMDIIVSNPPYIESDDVHLSQGDLRFEPQGALTDFADGLSALKALIDGAPMHLKSGGWLLMEHGFDQGEAVRTYFAQKGCWHNTETLLDYAGLDRITLAKLA